MIDIKKIIKGAESFDKALDEIDTIAWRSVASCTNVLYQLSCLLVSSNHKETLCNETERLIKYCSHVKSVDLDTLKTIRENFYQRMSFKCDQSSIALSWHHTLAITLSGIIANRDDADDNDREIEVDFLHSILRENNPYYQETLDKNALARRKAAHQLGLIATQSSTSIECAEKIMDYFDAYINDAYPAEDLFPGFGHFISADKPELAPLAETAFSRLLIYQVTSPLLVNAYEQGSKTANNVLKQKCIMQLKTLAEDQSVDAVRSLGEIARHSSFETANLCQSILDNLKTIKSEFAEAVGKSLKMAERRIDDLCNDNSLEMDISSKKLARLKKHHCKEMNDLQDLGFSELEAAAIIQERLFRLEDVANDNPGH